MKTTKLFAVSTVAILALAANAARAQESAAQDAATAADAPSGGLADVIVVTASKREQNLQTVGTAITAISAEKLAKLGTADVTAISTMVPSLQTYTYAPTMTVFNIRGVSQNDYSDSQEAPIAFYTDGAYVSAGGAISGQLFDISQVEVLRGPQGTLFGRNATGGVIQVESARPTRELDGYLKISVGSYDEIASEGAISGSLTSGIRGRLSFMTDKHDGYVTNLFNNTRLGDANRWAVRGQIAADVPGGQLHIKTFYTRNNNETPAGYKPVPAIQDENGLGVLDPTGTDILGYRDDNGPFTVSFNQQPLFDRKYYGGTVTYTGSLGRGVEITSITDYQHLDKFYIEDTDASPNRLYSYIAGQSLDQGSEELRLSAAMGNLKWVAGAYAMVIRTRASQLNGFEDVGSITELANLTKTRSFAVFGQVEYNLGKVTVIGGLRGSFDRKAYDYTLNQRTFAPEEPSDVTVNYNPSLDPRAVRHDNNWSGKFEVDYKPNDDILLYASVNRGTKAGGYAAPSTISVPEDEFFSLITFDQEVLTNYEAGFKAALAGNRLRVNGSVFHYDYNGYQTFTNIGLQAHIANNPAKVDGVELEVTASPIRNLTLNAYGSYLNSRVFDVGLSSGISVERRMPQAPRWSGGASLSYTQPTSLGDFRFDTNWSYSGRYFFEAFNAPSDFQTGYWLGDASVSFTPKALPQLDFSVAVKNVTNNVYNSYGYDLSFQGLQQFTIGLPRWVLASVTYRL